MCLPAWLTQLFELTGDIYHGYFDRICSAVDFHVSDCYRFADLERFQELIMPNTNWIVFALLLVLFTAAARPAVKSIRPALAVGAFLAAACLYLFIAAGMFPAY